MIILGIDPGLDGAICFLYHTGRAEVADLPTVPIETGGTVRRRLHGPALRSIIRQYCTPGEPVIAVIEDLSAGGRDSSAQTVGSQYRTRGTIETTLELLGLKPHVVHARTWKAFFGIGKDKDQSLRLARELFPELAEVLKRAGDHNRAESVLIARWGMQNLT